VLEFWALSPPSSLGFPGFSSPSGPTVSASIFSSDGSGAFLRSGDSFSLARLATGRGFSLGAFWFGCGLILRRPCFFLGHRHGGHFVGWHRVGLILLCLGYFSVGGISSGRPIPSLGIPLIISFSERTSLDSGASLSKAGNELKGDLATSSPEFCNLGIVQGFSSSSGFRLITQGRSFISSGASLAFSSG
jgi:hypothetical protein